MEIYIMYSNEWQMLKVFLIIIEDLNWQFLLVRQP